MNKFSKLSLYDFLAMLIPGFVILWLLDFCGIKPVNADNGIFLGLLSYLVGLCYHKLVECLCSELHLIRNECMEKCAWKEFYKKQKENKEIPEDIDNHFMEVYYKIAKKGCLMNIPVLEAQEVFLRNAVPLILISIGKISCCQTMSCHCSLVIFLIVLLLFSIFAWFSIQKKIYYLIWEGECYLSKLEK